MTETIAVPNSPKSLVMLSRLLFPQRRNESTAAAENASTVGITEMDHEEFKALHALAESNHVLVRAFEIALRTLRNKNDEMRAAWVSSALAAERSRANHAISVLQSICAAFAEEGNDVTVIKSLDHLPDLGSDLDLYTNAAPKTVIDMLRKRFHAELGPRSWGDRLAGKWNFCIPDLPELVEIHMRRLGQTGEQMVLASRIAAHSQPVSVAGQPFRVPAISDRLMISTLQRMYRHFYFRLCDIVDSAEIADSGAIDYEELRSSATACGIWEGVATYLAIVSDYVRNYRGTGLDLPDFVRASAQFGGEQIYFAKDFLRVPILPQSARLYATKLAGLLRKRELNSSARLGLLPMLATAAVVGQKITGSDKGIW